MFRACKTTMMLEVCSSMFWRDVLVETFATFFLVSVQCALPLTWGKTIVNGDTMQTAIGMGAVVYGMAESFGPFGGAYMNPAVTIGMLVARSISLFKAFMYILVECAGAVAGAAFIYWVTPEAYREGLATTVLHPSVTVVQGVVIEVWITAMLVFTVHGATNKERKDVVLPGLTIGFVVALGIMSAASSTGASMNPARSLGPAFLMGIWTDHWVYWLGPIVGGIIATIFYVYIFDGVGKMSESRESTEACIKNHPRTKMDDVMDTMKCAPSIRGGNRHKDTWMTVNVESGSDED